MKRISFISLFISVIFPFFNLYSQTVDNILEILETEEISGENAERLLDAVEQRSNNLINIYNINELSREEMMLLGLDNFQIFALENYIQRTGQLFSVNELNFVNGFDSLTISKIAPYLVAVPIEKKHTLKLDSVFSKGRQDIRFQYIQNLKTPYGFLREDGKGFKGENFSSSLRYNLKYYDCMELSLVGEKDYGEPLYYKNKTYGYDHYSFSFTIRDITKNLKQVTLGNYRINLGEGLAMKQSFALNSLASGYGAKHSNNNISPFRSTTEYNYNTGIAVKIEVNKFDVTLFGAYNKLDFNGKTIQQTGYHRTEKELLQKDSDDVLLAGTNIQYYNKGWIIGLTAFAYHYKDSIQKGNQSYQQYNFEGTDNNIVAINSSYEWKKFIVFTEIARSKSNAFAQLLGLQINFNYKTTLSVVARNYDKKYQNYYADALGYHTNNQNERGIYIDYSRYLNKRMSYFVGLDYYYFPFLAYRANSSSYGMKMKGQLEYKYNEKQTVNLYFRLNNHQYNDTNSKGEVLPMNNIVAQWQLRYKYCMNDYLTFAGRTGYSHSFTNDSKSNNGYFAYIEMISKLFNSKLTLNARYTYFHTTDYDNRFYIYEYSLPISYSSQMLYNTGHRFYANLSYKPTKNIQIHLRYNITRYNHTNEISSGNDKIEGNIRHYIGGQIYFKI